jgi:hypothetical protein
VPAEDSPQITVDRALGFAVGALAINRATVNPSPWEAPEVPLRTRRFSSLRRREAPEPRTAVHH